MTVSGWLRDNLEIVFTVLIAVLPAIGWMARRYWTSESEREQAQHYSTIAQTIATMRANDVTYEELLQFRRFIATGQKAAQLLPLDPAANELTQAEALESWADDGPKTQGEMNEAARLEFESRDKELARIIISLGDALEPEEYEELQRAQETWVTFRDAHADFVGRLFEGGSMYPLWYITAVMGATNNRIDELSAYLEIRQSL